MQKKKYMIKKKPMIGLLFATLSFSFLLGANNKREVRVGDVDGQGRIISQIGVSDFENHKLKPLLTPIDNYYNTQKAYSMNNVGDIETTWDYYTGKNTLIAIIDSGFVYDHEDFVDAGGYSIYSDLSSYIYTDYDAGYVYRVPATSDNWECMKHEYDSDYGEWDTHGSNVAGSAAAALNDVGTVGIAPEATILALKIDFDFNSLALAIEYAADCGADVINMSLGAYDSSDPGPDGGFSGVASFLDESIDYARNTKGAIVIAAAGNENTSAKSYPACNPGVIGVGALNKNSSTARAWFSNFNKIGDTVAGDHNVDVMAPGYVWAPGLEGTELGNSPSNYPNPGYGATQGTSFASPITAGAAALWKEKHPLGTPDQFETDLYASSVDLSSFQYYGNGRLDVYELLDIDSELTGLAVDVDSLDLLTTSSPTNVTATSTSSTIKSWTSSNTNVFTVSATGLNTASSTATVTVVGEGNATLTVTDNLDNTKTIPVKVSAPASSHTLSFKTNSSDGTEDLTNETFLAEIISGADIITSVTNIYKVYSGANGIKLSSSKYNGTFTINLNQSYGINKIVISACKYGSDTTSLSVNGGTSQTITSTSFGDYTFTLDGSMINSFTVAATKRNYINGITLHFAEAATPPTVTDVVVTPSTLSLDVFNNPSSNLTATVNGTNGPSQEVTWSSSDNTIATVSSNGLVTALKAGLVTITATSTFDTTKEGTCSVTITDSTPAVPEELLTQDSPYLNGVPYKMYFTSNTYSSYYFIGSMTGYYGATSTNKNNGVDVYFEQNGTGQNLYFYASGVKNYFYVELSGDHKNFKFGTAVPSEAWIYSNDRDVICYPIGTDFYTFGTHGTYTTFAAFMFETKTVSNYHVQFVTTQEGSAAVYATAFLKYLTCDGSGNSAPTFASAKSWYVLELTCASLDQSAKNILKNATANPLGTDVEKAVARYDYIVNKYGTTTYTDFLNRNPASPVSINFSMLKIDYMLGGIFLGIITAITLAIIFSCKRKRRDTE